MLDFHPYGRKITPTLW